jgi:hypothetical protein
MTNPNVPMLERRLADRGLSGFALQRQSYHPEHFGDGDAVFVEAPLWLRFVFDRGQVWMDMSALPYPERFYQFDDVGVAFGWVKPDARLGAEEPEPLEGVLDRLQAHYSELRSGSLVQNNGTLTLSWRGRQGSVKIRFGDGLTRGGRLTTVDGRMTGGRSPRSTKHYTLRSRLLDTDPKRREPMEMRKLSTSEFTLLETLTVGSVPLRCPTKPVRGETE